MFVNFTVRKVGQSTMRTCFYILFLAGTLIWCCTVKYINGFGTTFFQNKYFSNSQAKTDKPLKELQLDNTFLY
jgi:hypothetical protein